MNNTKPWTQATQHGRVQPELLTDRHVERLAARHTRDLEQTLGPWFYKEDSSSHADARTTWQMSPASRPLLCFCLVPPVATQGGDSQPRLPAANLYCLSGWQLELQNLHPAVKKFFLIFNTLPLTKNNSFKTEFDSTNSCITALSRTYFQN